MALLVAMRQSIALQRYQALRTVCSAERTSHTTPESQTTRGTVTIRFRGQQIDVPRGTKLRTALLKSGLSPHSDGAVYINCRGIGSCGTCAVEIRGPVEPVSWTTAERLRLNFPPHSAPSNSRLRLACQVSCMDDLEVIKYNKFWGEGDTPLPDLTERPTWVAPLGALEFVLDPQARGDGNSSDDSRGQREASPKQ